jgi:hypothetical protein
MLVSSRGVVDLNRPTVYVYLSSTVQYVCSSTSGCGAPHVYILVIRHAACICNRRPWYMRLPDTRRLLYLSLQRYTMKETPLRFFPTSPGKATVGARLKRLQMHSTAVS